MQAATGQNVELAYVDQGYTGKDPAEAATAHGNLARGARRMAAARVIVKRLAAIENFGSMDVLCSDKTGTLTEGEVKLHSAVGLDAKPSDDLLLHAFLNAHFQSGYTNPIDAAIQAHRSFDVSEYRKLDEKP